MKEDNVIVFPNRTGFLKGQKAAVVFQNSKIEYPTPDAQPIPLPGTLEKKGKVVPWGENNDLPQQIITKTGPSTDLSTGLLFNISAGYGEGIIPVKRMVENNKLTIVPYFDNQEINDFLEHNNINSYLLEQLTDMQFFYNVFPEIILDRNKSDKRKVVELTHKEAAFSRWTAMDINGDIKYHAYSALWGDNVKKPTDEDIILTDVLNFHRPIPDLLERIGRRSRRDGKKIDDKVYRYIVPVRFPTPGRTYYQKPYWYSIIESGWYDFAQSIPQFKKYLIQNGMAIRYMIYLDDDYFPDLFNKENITNADAQKARIKKEYNDLNKFITGLEQTGKSMVTFFKSIPGQERQYRIEIKMVDGSKLAEGGQYLEDSGEVSNMIAYTLQAPPSILGVAPGKNNSFSGTDKRELFIIKQALMKPIRDLLLRPLYLVKAINNWPSDVYFAIPNVELTTLDKNSTGTDTKIPLA